ALLGLSANQPTTYLTPNSSSRDDVTDINAYLKKFAFCCRRERRGIGGRSLVYTSRGRDGSFYVNACIEVWPVRVGRRWEISDYVYAAISDRKRAPPSCGLPPSGEERLGCPQGL